jgi:hypothetical protein
MRDTPPELAIVVSMTSQSATHLVIDDGQRYEKLLFCVIHRWIAPFQLPLSRC